MWLGDIVKCDTANIVMSVLYTYTTPNYDQVICLPYRCVIPSLTLDFTFVDDQ